MKVVYADRSNVMVKSLDYGEEEEVFDFGFTTGWSVFYGGDALVQYIYPMYTGRIHAIFIRTVTTSQGTKQSIGLPGWIYPDGKYLYKDDEISASYEMFAYTGVEGGNLYLPYINQSAAKHGFATNYLGTICNLSSPVVKTSTQSMKVTYTLTDA